MASIGYELQRHRLDLSALPHWRIARVRPVTRVLEAGGEPHVPARVALQETRYLARYDAIKQATGESFDVRNNTLASCGAIAT